MTWNYTVRCIRKMKSITDGHLWRDMLPNELFEEQYTFDGWEASIDGRREVRAYELFWYPETFELATELYARLHELKDHMLFEGCDFKFTILKKRQRPE